MKKLFRYQTNEPIKYYDGRDVLLPEYQFKIGEKRGVWVSTVANIDLPKMTSISEYQNFLVEMMANIASYNINLVIFQVRPSNDAFYRSKINPWSRFITGTEGLDPGFDVLAFVIEEAKKYSIEIHAWMNPYRVSTAELSKLDMTKEQYLATLAPNNFARLNPEETILDGIGKIILKPASDKVISFVTETIIEVINNYDITGVHIDDYFYPYAKIPRETEEIDYQASLKFQNQTEDEFSFEDWRRYNVDKMIKNISDTMKKSPSKEKRNVAFGISPFAIYRTNKALDEKGWEKGSFHKTGVCECYATLYSDVYKWMKEGWIDYVTPQIYFPFERLDVNYHDLLEWWVNICLETKTTLYVGQGLYQMGSNEVWQNPEEICNQLCLNRLHESIAGTIFFTYHDLVAGRNDIKDRAIVLLKQYWQGK